MTHGENTCGPRIDEEKRGPMDPNSTGRVLAPFFQMTAGKQKARPGEFRILPGFFILVGGAGNAPRE